jgi:hypothetical protein
MDAHVHLQYHLAETTRTEVTRSGDHWMLSVWDQHMVLLISGSEVELGTLLANAQLALIAKVELEQERSKA